MFFLLLLVHLVLLAAVLFHCGDYNPSILRNKEKPITLAEMDAMYPKKYNAEEWIKIWSDDDTRLQGMSNPRLNELEYRGKGYWPKMRGPVKLLTGTDVDAERSVALADIKWCDHYVAADMNTGAQAGVDKKNGSERLDPK